MRVARAARQMEHNLVMRGREFKSVLPWPAPWNLYRHCEEAVLEGSDEAVSRDVRSLRPPRGGFALAQGQASRSPSFDELLLRNPFDYGPFQPLFVIARDPSF